MLCTKLCAAWFRDDHGRLPLHWAAASGCAEVAQALLDGAQAARTTDPAPTNESGEPADALDDTPSTEVKVSAALQVLNS